MNTYLRMLLNNNENFFNENFRYNVEILSPDGLMDDYYRDIGLKKTKELISKHHNIVVVNLTLGGKRHIVDGRTV